MEKFIWNWKFKYSLFNKREKVAFPVLVLSLLIATISLPFLLHQEKYNVTFYDDQGEVLFVEKHTNNTNLELTHVFPKDSANDFYGWSDTPDKFNHIKSITVESNLNLYAFNLTYDEKIENKVIDFDTIRKDDSELLKGEEEIKQPGKKGTRALKYKIYIVDGEIIKEELLSDKIISNPTDEIVNVGIKEQEEIIENSVANSYENNGGNYEINAFVSGKPEPNIESKSSYSETEQEYKEISEDNEQNSEVKEPGHSYVPIYGVEIIPNDYNDKFKNCSQLREVYPFGVPAGHPAYENYPRGDRDKDGWACETKGSPSEFLD